MKTMKRKTAAMALVAMVLFLMSCSKNNGGLGIPDVTSSNYRLGQGSSVAPLDANGNVDPSQIVDISGEQVTVSLLDDDTLLIESPSLGTIEVIVDSDDLDNDDENDDDGEEDDDYNEQDDEDNDGDDDDDIGITIPEQDYDGNLNSGNDSTATITTGQRFHFNTNNAGNVSFQAIQGNGILNVYIPSLNTTYRISITSATIQ